MTPLVKLRLSDVCHGVECCGATADNLLLFVDVRDTFLSCHTATVSSAFFINALSGIQ